jgi:TetR/AcrR family tetracycline transcriptional repressor
VFSRNRGDLVVPVSRPEKNGATYWHFPSKQVWLAAMADAMLDGVVADGDDRPGWPERLAEVARRLRRALLARRDGARLFAGAFFPLPNALGYGETMVGILRGAGLSSRDATWAVDTVTYYVVGHSTEEQLAAGLPDGGKAAAERLTDAPDRCGQDGSLLSIRARTSVCSASR